MPNVITPYDPIWYANRALERLEKSLNFTRSIFRDYHEEPREKGSTIEIRKPGGFVAQQMPITTATDLDPSKVQLVVDQHWGVAMKIGDKERAYTGERIINEHVAPAMQALAEKIEATALALYADVPWVFTGADPAVLNDLIQLRKQMNDNSVPRAGRFICMNSEREADLLAITNFLNSNEGSDGAQTQRDGILGRKFGFDLFTNDLTVNHTAGALVPTGTFAVQGAHAKGATQVTLDASTTLTGTVKKGDVLTITGLTQKFAFTADAAAAGNAITVGITPALPAAVADNTVVSVTQQSKGISLAFERAAFAIAMAPLADDANGQGAQIASVVDPRTSLAIRVTRWYEPKDAEWWLRFDGLWGVKTLDGNRAVRWEGPLV